MIDKILLIRILQAVGIFLAVFFLLSFVFSKSGGKVKKRGNMFNTYSPTTLIYIFLAAAGITYIVSQFSYSKLTSAMVFVGLLGMAPLLLNNERKRIMQEDIFADVILYSQNMGMLLRQTHNVYASIDKASEDLSTSLKTDVRGVLASLEEGREQTKKAMETLEHNYPYSCIKNLDLIILHMFYENANVDDSLLMTYQDDVTTLEQDVRRNKLKRRSLRTSYLIITIGSLLTYWVFLATLNKSFEGAFNTDLFRIFNTGYLFATMLAFMAVDRYFNLNTTKE